MENTKRKYKKHKLEKKVSVRFYLNKKLKAKNINDKLLYPLYVQVIINSQTKHFKSLTNLYTSEDQLSNFLEINKILFSEEERIIKKTLQASQNVITQHQENSELIPPKESALNKRVLLDVEDSIHGNNELDDIIESALKEILQVSLVYDKSIDYRDRLYLIKLINWDNLDAKYLYQNISKIVKDPTPSYERILEDFTFLAINYQKGTFRSVFPLGVQVCDWVNGDFVTIWRERYNGPDKQFIESMIPDILKLISSPI